MWTFCVMADYNINTTDFNHNLNCNVAGLRSIRPGIRPVIMRFEILTVGILQEPEIENPTQIAISQNSPQSFIKTHYFTVFPEQQNIFENLIKVNIHHNVVVICCLSASSM